MLNCNRYGLAFGVGVGVGVCVSCVVAGEAFQFKLPSAIACSSPSIYLDLGPPPGCDTNEQPHSRTGWLTSLSTGTGTVTGPATAILPAPRVAYTYRDLEDAAAFYDRGFEIANSMNGWTVATIENATNLLHPTKAERLAFRVRSSCDCERSCEWAFLAPKWERRESIANPARSNARVPFDASPKPGTVSP
jgi:hypothetical protein